MAAAEDVVIPTEERKIEGGVGTRSNFLVGLQQ